MLFARCLRYVGVMAGNSAFSSSRGTRIKMIFAASVSCRCANLSVFRTRSSIGDGGGGRATIVPTHPTTVVMASQAEGKEGEEPVKIGVQGTHNDPSVPLSGRCLCGALRWTLPLSASGSVSQVLVCHCSMCRRVSGSSSVPYAALPRKPLLDSMVTPSSSSHLGSYSSSGVASRGFCRTCGSNMYMDYNEEHTLWIPIGTIDHFDIDTLVDPSRNSQIFLESKADYTDALAKLPHLQSFGSYKPDPCQPMPFEKMKTWEELEHIASFATAKAEGDGESSE